MGQHAGDIIDGRCCDLCGQFFVDKRNPKKIHEHGHPATCWECWDELDKEEKTFHNKANTDTI